MRVLSIQPLTLNRLSGLVGNSRYRERDHLEVRSRRGVVEALRCGRRTYFRLARGSARCMRLL
jgi:hypothetical protein